MKSKSNAHKEPIRLEGLSRFFKRYISVSSSVTAALPIPVAALGLIPTYSFQTKVLSTYTSLFCFLILAFIFYSRHKLARIMFPEFYRVVNKKNLQALQLHYTLLLIISSLFCVFMYQGLLSASITDKRAEFGLPPSKSVRFHNP